MITVAAVAFEDERAQSLWADQQREMEAIYHGPAAHPALTDDKVIVSLLALGADGEPVGTALARWSHYHPGSPGAAEIKRLYVAPQHRGHRHARVIMGALERAAWRAGATELVLETGVPQPQALAVYRAIGYTDIAGYGPYALFPDSVCLGKQLPTRVLVINGTIGAGKTHTAAAIHALLTEAGSRSAFIDADALCQAAPMPAADPYGQGLLVANLTAVAPVYRAQGFGCVVLARVVEDAKDRDSYADAFAGGGGRAHVSIVRIVASEEVRMRRIAAREGEGSRRDVSMARTVELDDVLEELGLDDGVVSSEGSSPRDVARAALDAAGW